MLVKETGLEFGYDFGHFTIGQCIALASRLGMRVGDVILEEASGFTGKSREEVFSDMERAFEHNIKAAEIGLESGSSSLLGEIGQELNGRGGKEPAARIVDDAFVNRIITITLAAQVGNYTIGLRP